MQDLIPAWVDGALVPSDKLRVHQEGWPHKAVSVFLNCGDMTLIQRRAAGKYHSGGLWANSCCTHPRWDETPEACATRRLREELGIEGVSLTPTGALHYRADVGGGLIEDEHVTVLVGEVPRDLPMALNPSEVSDVAWVRLDDLRAELVAHPEKFTAWVKIYFSNHQALLTV